MSVESGQRMLTQRIIRKGVQKISKDALEIEIETLIDHYRIKAKKRINDIGYSQYQGEHLDFTLYEKL